MIYLRNSKHAEVPKYLHKVTQHQAQNPAKVYSYFNIWSIFLNPLWGHLFKMSLIVSCSICTSPSSWEANAARTEHPRCVHRSSLNWYLQKCNERERYRFVSNWWWTSDIGYPSHFSWWNFGSRTDIKSWGTKRSNATEHAQELCINVPVPSISSQCIFLYKNKNGFHANISFRAYQMIAMASAWRFTGVGCCTVVPLITEKGCAADQIHQQRQTNNSNVHALPFWKHCIIFVQHQSITTY